MTSKMGSARQHMLTRGRSFALNQTAMAADGFALLPGKKTWSDWVNFCTGVIEIWGEPKAYSFSIKDSEGNQYPCECEVHDVRTHRTSQNGMFLVRLSKFPSQFPGARMAAERMIRKFIEEGSQTGVLVSRMIVITTDECIVAKPGDIPIPEEVIIDNSNHDRRTTGGNQHPRRAKRQ